jgi:hypothetical protein
VVVVVVVYDVKFIYYFLVLISFLFRVLFSRILLSPPLLFCCFFVVCCLLSLFFCFFCFADGAVVPQLMAPLRIPYGAPMAPPAAVVVAVAVPPPLPSRSPSLLPSPSSNRRHRCQHFPQQPPPCLHHRPHIGPAAIPPLSQSPSPPSGHRLAIVCPLSLGRYDSRCGRRLFYLSGLASSASSWDRRCSPPHSRAGPRPCAASQHRRRSEVAGQHRRHSEAEPAGSSSLWERQIGRQGDWQICYQTTSLDLGMIWV